MTLFPHSDSCKIAEYLANKNLKDNMIFCWFSTFSQRPENLAFNFSFSQSDGAECFHPKKWSAGIFQEKKLWKNKLKTSSNNASEM